MRGVFIDTNVLLDVALIREPFFHESRQVLNWCEDNRESVSAWVAEHSITNAYYILRRPPIGDEKARVFLQALLEWVGVASNGKELLTKGLSIPGGDFEDTLQALCAESISAEVIVTRNVKDFNGSKVRAMTPGEFLSEYVFK